MDGGLGGLELGIRYHVCPVGRPLAGAIATILVMVKMMGEKTERLRIHAMLPMVVNEMRYEMKDRGAQMERTTWLWPCVVRGGAI